MLLSLRGGLWHLVPGGSSLSSTPAGRNGRRVSEASDISERSEPEQTVLRLQLSCIKRNFKEMVQKKSSSTDGA